MFPPDFLKHLGRDLRRIKGVAAGVSEPGLPMAPASAPQRAAFGDGWHRNLHRPEADFAGYAWLFRE
ncbi:hypothetical protein A6U91_26895 [Agrobacterium tumefaciens]|uniref:Uncharacterized protein n=1 Tax=Agrobacterium tumefaciens TaxID=358 RepID=A0AB36EK44_AGRTU|nr:hypothetical protein A6U91_26895 [Agrobacterium tumefaciens]